MPTDKLSLNEVAELLKEHYDFAASAELTEIHAGPSSHAWRVDVRGDRRSYCLKEHKNRSLERLRGEHNLMTEMREADFALTPEVVASTAGDTVILWGERPYALYRFIESDGVFNWTVGGWSMGQAHSAGIVLAEFHVFAENRRGALGTTGTEPSRIEDLRDWGLSVLQRASGMFPDDVMIQLSNFEEILRSAFVATSDDRSHGVIHGDFHPGNVLFHGEHVVGVLDFEYCRIDSRLFDVAYAVMTFSFEALDAEFARAFLDGYNAAAIRSNAFPNFVEMTIAQLQPLVRLSAWLSSIWLIEQCQRGAAAHDEVLPSLRKCIAHVSATLD